jgi:hypothetical protein
MSVLVAVWALLAVAVAATVVIGFVVDSVPKRYLKQERRPCCRGSSWTFWGRGMGDAAHVPSSMRRERIAVIALEGQDGLADAAAAIDTQSGRCLAFWGPDFPPGPATPAAHQ